MTFFVRPELDEKILDVVSGGSVRCAVAFWGVGSDSIFRNAQDGISGVRIVCNLNSGGTNPSAIRTLMGTGADVRQCDNLHAKVYISDRGAIVASANASANGMGLEGREQGGWIEAGNSLDEMGAKAAGLWFEMLWMSARNITKLDMAAAQKMWSARRSSRPMISTFANFEIDLDDFPLIDWRPISGEAFIANDSAIMAENGAKIDAGLRENIINGVDIPAGDENLFAPHGRWVLRWFRTRRGIPHRQRLPEWKFVARIFPDAGHYRNSTSPVAVGVSDENGPKAPFDIGEAGFYEKFCETMAEARFARLREFPEEGGVWFSTRLDCMREFWRQLHLQYKQSSDA